MNKTRHTGWAAPKDRYCAPVLFNPYTGEPRDVRDVQSDPQGLLIVPFGALQLAAAPEAPAQGDPLEKLTRIQEELGLYDDKPAQQARGERQSYRDDDDMPTEVAVLKREWKAMRLALSMPRTPTRVDLIQCLKCQQFWTGPVDAECPHCNPAQPSVPAPWREAMKVAREALKNVEENCAAGDEYPESFMKPGFDPDKLNAALAQLDSLEGGE